MSALEAPCSRNPASTSKASFGRKVPRDPRVHRVETDEDQRMTRGFTAHDKSPSDAAARTPWRDMGVEADGVFHERPELSEDNRLAGSGSIP